MTGSGTNRMPSCDGMTIRSKLRGITPQQINLDGIATKKDIAEIETKIEIAKSEIMKWMFGGFLAIISLLVGVLLKLSG
jgi:hypothetical protein